MSPRSIAGWYDATHSRRNSIDVGLSNTFTVELTQKSPTSILNSSISLSDDHVEAECTQQVKRRYSQLSSIIYLIYRRNAFSISKINKAKKIIKNKDKKIQIYIFFYYLQNELYFWKYDDKINLRVDNNCNYRGVRKQYAYIPTILLTKIN